MADRSQHDAAYPVNARGRACCPGMTDDEKTWAMFAHLSLLAHLVAPAVAVVIPLVIYLIRREGSAFVEDHAREALNFQISLVVYSLLAVPLAIITCGVGGLLALLVYPLGIVGMILAAMATSRGEFYRYPMTFRLVG